MVYNIVTETSALSEAVGVLEIKNCVSRAWERCGKFVLSKSSSICICFFKYKYQVFFKLKPSSICNRQWDGLSTYNMNLLHEI